MPLTDNQKRQLVQEKEGEKKRAAAAKTKADNEATAAMTKLATDAMKDANVTPQAAAGFTPWQKRDTSSTHAPWAQPCTFWAAGQCEKGIACPYRHDGIKSSEGRCFICGDKDHNASQCEAPGGKADPKRDEHWSSYKKLKQERMPNMGKGKGDTKGKGKGDGKKGGKGDGGKAKCKTARASAVTAGPTFPI